MTSRILPLHSVSPTLFIGLIAASVFSTACQKEIEVPKSDPVLLQRAMELQREVYALELENQELREDAGQADAFRRQLAENITEFELAKLERDKTKSDYESLHRDYDELIAQLEPLHQLLETYEGKLRLNLEGENLGDVELRDGRFLGGAVVGKVEAEWVSLNHTNGITNVDFNMLPDHLQRTFNFRPSMVTADSLIAQQPLAPEPQAPKFSPEDAAKAMHEAMAAERENKRRQQQEGYRAEIAKLTQEIAKGKGYLKALADQKAAKRRNLSKSRTIKISKADQEQALGKFDFKIEEARHEILSREARLFALRTMLDPEPEADQPPTGG